MVPKIRSCYCSFLQLCQKVPRFLCNPKVRYGVHNGQPLVSILSQINPAHGLPSCLRSILILSSYLRLAFQMFSFLYVPHQNSLCTFLFPQPQTRHTRRPSDSIIQIIFGEKCKSWCYKLCHVLQSSSAHYSRTPRPVSSKWYKPFSTVV
jgi:hypothetical protein